MGAGKKGPRQCSRQPTSLSLALSLFGRLLSFFLSVSSLRRLRLRRSPLRGEALGDELGGGQGER